MAHNTLMALLPTLKTQKQLCIIGAAVIDMIVDAPYIPERGGDVEMQEKGIHVGGCALNVAITVKKLGIESINALPIGKGKWADLISQTMSEKGIESHLVDSSGDNGWCIALVEPDGERTFLSVAGVENNFTSAKLSGLGLNQDAIIYLSGYQLASTSGDDIITWLESLPKSMQIFIDFGPRISAISSHMLQRIMQLKPIVSLNRQEARFMGMNDALPFVKQWNKSKDCPLILRLDSDGAFYSSDTSYRLVAPFQTEVVDTIGAGDTHAGGVLAALSSGWELADAVLLGNAVASYVVSHQGGDCAPNIKQLSDHLLTYSATIGVHH